MQELIELMDKDYPNVMSQLFRSLGQYLSYCTAACFGFLISLLISNLQNATNYFAKIETINGLGRTENINASWQDIWISYIATQIVLNISTTAAVFFVTSHILKWVNAGKQFVGSVMLVVVSVILEVFFIIVIIVAFSLFVGFSFNTINFAKTITT